MSAHDVALEFLRRTMAGQTNEDLRQYITQALIDDGGAQDENGWRIRTAADALAPHPPLEYLVHGLLPMPSLSIVYGGPGSLKSMLLADLCVCVAGGCAWLESRPGTRSEQASFTTTQAPTLWIDFDNGARRTDIRFGALLRAHMLGPDTPCHYVSMPTPHLDASKERHIDALAGLIHSSGYRLVVVDNLGLITGDTEENSAGMANVMGHLRRLSEETGAAIVLIHHQRKSAVNGDSGVRRGETLRGHSSIEASLDLALLIERKAGEDSVTIYPTKVRDYLPFIAAGALFTFEHAGDSHDLHAARFFANASMSAEEAATAQLRCVIVEVVRSQPGVQQRDLVTEVRDRMAVLTGVKQPGVNKVRGTIALMVDDKTLRTAGTDKTGLRYYA